MARLRRVKVARIWLEYARLSWVNIVNIFFFHGGERQPVRATEIAETGDAELAEPRLERQRALARERQRRRRARSVRLR